MRAVRLHCRGGLGNQLFQYAALKGLTRRAGINLEIDVSNYSADAADSKSFWLSKLPIKARVLPKRSTGPLQRRTISTWQRLAWKKYDEPSLKPDPGFFRITPGTIVSGYFQSLSYMLPRDLDTMAELDLKRIAPTALLDFIREIKPVNYVSVHVRRDDYVGNSGTHQEKVIPYLSAAMAALRARLGRGQVKFLVFSDDIAWCRSCDLFTNDCDLIEPNRFGENPCFDMLLMSECAHHIIANSTFSWWAAWREMDATKICVMPSYWVSGWKTVDLGLKPMSWICI